MRIASPLADSSYIDLVLIGGGHAQIQVLRSFGMAPEHGVRLTLITDVLNTPYSGMLPGHIEGVWSEQDIYINLVKLARFAGARLIHQAVKNVDFSNKTIWLQNNVNLNYDLLSVNCGAAPDLSSIPGADRYAVAVKPISQFLDKLPAAGDITGPICIIGAGAAGAELALAFRHRYGTSADIHLIGRSSRVLPTRTPRASRHLVQALRQQNVTLHLGEPVNRITSTDIHLGQHKQLGYDHVFLVTSARPADWTAGLSLKKDTGGYIQVSPALQSASHDTVFAAGDIASISGFPREKAGVFAVRAGPVLCHNLRAFIRGKRLKSWTPQRQYLALIGLGNGRALASWGPLAASGAFWWMLKSAIDRRFMTKFSVLPEMFKQPAAIPELARQLGRMPDMSDSMFCAACGAKTDADRLQQAIDAACDMAAEAGANPDYLPDRNLTTDHAELSLPTDTRTLSQSVDYISQHISDPFCFGQIAALHALSDIFVAGHQPLSALATVIMRRDHADIQADDLAQMLAGSLVELSRHNTRLVGGHTSISDQAGLGFAVTGMAVQAAVQKKPDLAAGVEIDLLLTKPIGTGVILAAEMRRLCSAASYIGAVQVMLQSNFQAAQIIAQLPQALMTDVTGFGLARHALNLARRVGAAGVTLYPETCPFITGALPLSAAGIHSSLFTNNQRGITPMDTQKNTPAGRLMFDPQTSGGILAAVPRPQVKNCLHSLRQAGYSHATVIGRLSAVEGLHFSPDARHQ